jgi:ABC-type nitrate/sulfonate/bicarbonate transport system substrate-binding protein
MASIELALLRGVCQMPAYAAHECGFLRDEGIESEIAIAATAWMVPQRLEAGECQFAVIPWTRVAAAGGALVAVCGSGREEAAIVVREGVAEDEVRRVVVPLRGGIKDLTAMGLIRSLGWEDAEIMRQPSGDGAIIAFFGQGADAASMVEPYATMMESLGVGRAVRRTGDLWSGAPGCSLTTTPGLVRSDRGLVAAVVRAFVRGAELVRAEPDRAADIASRYIGINARFVLAALDRNLPRPDALRNERAIAEILGLMSELGYVERPPEGFIDLSFLDAVDGAETTVAARAASA